MDEDISLLIRLFTQLIQVLGRVGKRIKIKLQTIRENRKKAKKRK